MTESERGDAERIEDLVTECILALDRGDSDAVERILSSHPDSSADVRQRLAMLQRSGLLAAAAIAPEIPERVGPYRIVGKLGVGGMGVVYLAEQTEPVERQVALKVIKLGMDTGEVLERFRIESQALALMNHPGVARVFDVGATETGRPYFAMEYVEGDPITAYADQRRLTIEQRVRLFGAVCEAVQHAHHKGIIHRDLKPSNILVSDSDGRAQVKVIDFGVAKAIHSPLGRARLTTSIDRILGTPEYMSPEQAVSVLDVDTRTDVYSLGAVLYELLSGCPVFDPVRVRRASQTEIERLLREEEPPPPARRVSVLGAEATDIAVARQFGGERDLSSQLRGDLDWITIKALAKDRDRRYASPGALAEDLERHLSHEPVSAGPPSVRYRWGKFVRRYRVQVASAAAILLVLIVGIAASLWMYRGVLEARTHEQAARMVAERNLETATDAIRQMLTRVGSVWLAEIPRSEQLRRQLLEDALELHRELVDTKPTDPRLQRIAASSHQLVAQLLLSLGELGEVAPHLAAARDLIADQGTAGPGESGAQLALLRSRLADTEARLARDLGDFDASAAALRAGLGEVEPALAVDSGNPQLNLQRLTMLATLGRLLGTMDRGASAAVYAEGTELADRLAKPADAPVDVLMKAAAFHAGYADFARRYGMKRLADGQRQAAGDCFERIPPKDRQRPRMRQMQADLEFMAASRLVETGATVSTLATFDEALGQLQELVEEFPDSPSFAMQLIEQMIYGAAIHHEFGKEARAAELEGAAISKCSALCERYPTAVSHRVQLARALGSRASRLLNRIEYGQKQDPTAVVEFAERSLDSVKLGRAMGAKGRYIGAIESNSLALLAAGRLQTGVPEAALPLLERATEVVEQLLTQAPNDVSLLQSSAGIAQTHGRVFRELNRLAEASARFETAVVYREAISRVRPDEIDTRFSLRDALMEVIAVRVEAGQLAGAREAAEQAIERLPGQWLIWSTANAAYVSSLDPRADNRSEQADWATRILEISRVGTDLVQREYADSRMQPMMLSRFAATEAAAHRALGDPAAATATLERALTRFELASTDGATHGGGSLLRFASATMVTLVDDYLGRGDLAGACQRISEFAANHSEDKAALRLAVQALARCLPRAAAAAEREMVESAAIAQLERALDLGAISLEALRNRPELAPLRELPRVRSKL